MKAFYKGVLAAALVFIKTVSALADALPDDTATPAPAATKTAAKSKPKPAPVDDLDDGLGDDGLSGGDDLDDGLGDDGLSGGGDDLDDEPAAAASKYTADQTMKKLMELKGKLGSKDVPMKLMARAIGDPKTPCVIANVPVDKLDALYDEAVKRIKAASAA